MCERFGICNSKMKHFMPAKHLNSNHVITIFIHFAKMHFQNSFVILVCCVAKNMTSLFISMRKCYDSNSANF